MTSRIFCEDMAKIYLPPIRSMIAKQLIQQYDHSQLKTAIKLGTTQAGVSQYLRSRRGTKTRNDIIDNAKLRESIQRVTEKMAMSEEENSFKEHVCDLCQLIRKEVNLL